MYCPSCGVASTPGLKYCNRCGASLSLAGDTKQTKPTQAAVIALLDSIFWVTVLGLGAIVGGVVAMKALELRDVFIVAYMILSTLAFLGIYGMHFWQFIRLTSESKKFGNTTDVDEPDTKELDPAPARVLTEFRPSVTEQTTHTLEPVTTRRKAE